MFGAFPFGVPVFGDAPGVFAPAPPSGRALVVCNLDAYPLNPPLMAYALNPPLGAYALNPPLGAYPLCVTEDEP